MNVLDEFQRVTRARPCPICGRPDWCGVSADGAVAICMRIADGATKPTKNGGWLHILGESRGRRLSRKTWTIPIRPEQTDALDLEALALAYQHDTDPDRLQTFAGSLGLTAESLEHLGVGWSGTHWAWCFPMTDAQGRVRGIRLRRPDGSKFAVKGGHEGLFIPSCGTQGTQGTHHEQGTLLICEGPTDTAALLDLGFPCVVGRPSCRGGVDLLRDLCRTWRPTDVAIAADGDEPGWQGAEALASVLVGYVPSLRVFRPPDGVKDVRDWIRGGANRQDVNEVIQAAPIRRLCVRLERAA